MRKMTVFLLVSALLLMGASASARISHGYTPLFTLHVAGLPVGETTVPKANAIAEIYPNPFNPRVTIVFEVAESGPADLCVYDLAGRLVRRLESGSKPGGRYETTWDGRDDRGRNVSTGIYFCRLATPQGSSTMKMTLAR